MSYSYEYDKSGLASSYLALSFLVPITLVYIYFCFTRKSSKSLKCSTCPSKKSTPFFSFFMLFMLLCLVSFFINNIRTIKMEIKKDFDPLEILGVSLNATPKQIKRKMQNLLMKYSVQKAPEDKKKEYEKICMNISKAYVIMKNKESFNSWLNTESKSGEIMAIPEIIMENAFTAFLIYCVILGVALPFYAFKKWKSMKNKNRLGVNFKSMEEIIGYFNEDLRKKGNVKNLIWILSRSVEFNLHKSDEDFKDEGSSFKDKGINKDSSSTTLSSTSLTSSSTLNTSIPSPSSSSSALFKSIKDKVGEDYGYPLPDPKTVPDGLYIFYDFLFRTGLSSPLEKKKIVKFSLSLVECMKLIAFNRGYIDLLKEIFTLQSMIVQAVFDEEYYFLQYPFVNFKDLFILKIKKGGKIPGEALKCLLENSKLKEAEKLRESIPKIVIDEFVATVKKTRLIEEEGNEEDEVSDIKEDNDEEINNDNGVHIIPKGSLVTIKARFTTTNNLLNVHTHFIDTPLEHSWTAFISIDNILHKKFIKISKSQEISFEFEAPGNRKSSEVQLYLLDGFYLKNNLEESILIKYV